MAQTERPSEWNDASPRLPRLLVITLGVLSIAMVPGVFATTANPSGALLGAAPYFAIVLCLILGMRWRGAFVDTIFAGAAPAAIFVLGLGSLVVFEVARLAGNGGVSKLWTFVGGTAMGLYLAPGLTALAAAGISRPWLPIGAMLLSSVDTQNRQLIDTSKPAIN